MKNKLIKIAQTKLRVQNPPLVTAGPPFPQKLRYKQICHFRSKNPSIVIIVAL